MAVNLHNLQIASDRCRDRVSGTSEEAGHGETSPSARSVKCAHAQHDSGVTASPQMFTVSWAGSRWRGSTSRHRTSRHPCWAGSASSSRESPTARCDLPPRPRLRRGPSRNADARLCVGSARSCQPPSRRAAARAVTPPGAGANSAWVAKLPRYPAGAGAELVAQTAAG